MIYNIILLKIKILLVVIVLLTVFYILYEERYFAADAESFIRISAFLVVMAFLFLILFALFMDKNIEAKRIINTKDDILKEFEYYKDRLQVELDDINNELKEKEVISSYLLGIISDPDLKKTMSDFQELQLHHLKRIAGYCKSVLDDIEQNEQYCLSDEFDFEEFYRRLESQYLKIEQQFDLCNDTFYKNYKVLFDKVSKTITDLKAQSKTQELVTQLQNYIDCKNIRSFMGKLMDLYECQINRVTQLKGVVWCCMTYIF